jgi:translation initiation factor 3 subunit G
VGENIIFRPSTNWRKDAKEEKTEVGSMKDKLKDKKVKCRICNGEHFTARCPFKDTMAPVGEEGSADVAAGPADAVEGPGGLGSGKSSYVPPHMRNGAAASGGDRMGGGKYERNDESTLRVTNVRSVPSFLSLHAN